MNKLKRRRSAVLPTAPAAPSPRLLIEPGEGEGFVYRLIEPATGRLLGEAPRERLKDLLAPAA